VQTANRPHGTKLVNCTAGFALLVQVDYLIFEAPIMTSF